MKINTKGYWLIKSVSVLLLFLTSISANAQLKFIADSLLIYRQSCISNPGEPCVYIEGKLINDSDFRQTVYKGSTNLKEELPIPFNQQYLQFTIKQGLLSSEVCYNDYFDVPLIYKRTSRIEIEDSIKTVTMFINAHDTVKVDFSGFILLDKNYWKLIDQNEVYTEAFEKKLERRGNRMMRKARKLSLKKMEITVELKHWQWYWGSWWE